MNSQLNLPTMVLIYSSAAAVGFELMMHVLQDGRYTGTATAEMIIREQISTHEFVKGGILSCIENILGNFILKFSC